MVEIPFSSLGSYRLDVFFFRSSSSVLLLRHFLNSKDFFSDYVSLHVRILHENRLIVIDMNDEESIIKIHFSIDRMYLES